MCRGFSSWGIWTLFAQRHVESSPIRDQTCVSCTGRQIPIHCTTREVWEQPSWVASPYTFFQFSSVQFSHSVVSNFLQSHGLQYARPPCPSPTAGAYSNSCPLSRWWHPTISSSVVPFSSCLQSFLASGSFHMSQFFTSGGQSIGVSASASALPMNIQGWFSLGCIGWISLQTKGLSRVFSNTTVQKHWFFGAQLSL